MITPAGIDKVAESAPLEVLNEASMITKAKELLTEAMEFKDLMDALEFFYIYGRKPEIVNGKPVVAGNNIAIEKGHESKHYTSSQLKRIIESVKEDLKPVETEEVITK